MTSPRRFFLLPEPLPSDTILTLLGRIVSHKLRPAEQFAPLAPTSGSLIPKHNPEDIIPTLLPAPIISTDAHSILTTARENSISVGLSDLFGLDLGRETELRVELESDEVKRYVLGHDPADVFDTLMSNDHYSADVEKLFARSGKNHAYFVTGFLTTTGTKWTRGMTKARSVGINVTVPVTAIAGAPMAFGNPNIAPKTTRKAGVDVSETVATEQVFAVSYNVVKISYRYERAQGGIKKVVKIGAPQRANAKTLALGEDDDTRTENSLDGEVDFYLSDDDDAVSD
ncbi:hypothetical protein NA57DRAFT_54323 [Rhizodiscina lignyota]|uniref:Uncharacterized protein n=1 Tax=Rhizodiscina lignyota TaxID=1504668 RepID=A0A9P4M7P5_9PEZI|nr:hypothetical protein NA57DRAFT_54323 [Rhizodiscina lignyota]